MACCVLVLGGNIIQYDDMIIIQAILLSRKCLQYLLLLVSISKQNSFASLEKFAQLWAGVMLVVWWHEVGVPPVSSSGRLSSELSVEDPGALR